MTSVQNMKRKRLLDLMAFEDYSLSLLCSER